MILWGEKASPLLEQAKLLCYNDRVSRYGNVVNVKEKLNELRFCTANGTLMSFGKCFCLETRMELSAREARRKT